MSFRPHRLYLLVKLDPLVCGVGGNVHLGKVFEKRPMTRLGVQLLERIKMTPEAISIGSFVTP